MQAVIKQIADEFLAGIAELDGMRKRVFLNWLSSHSAQAVLTEDLPKSLFQWLGTLNPADLLWEYRLVLSEIEWCAMLAPEALERFLREQV